MRAGIISDDSIVSSLCIRKTWDAEGGVDVLVLGDVRLPDSDTSLALPAWLEAVGVSGLGRFNQNGSEGI
jgi:hypothetical protein